MLVLIDEAAHWQEEAGGGVFGGIYTVGTASTGPAAFLSAAAPPPPEMAINCSISYNTTLVYNCRAAAV